MKFVDTLTGEVITIHLDYEEWAWEMLCDKYGSSYVFENIYIL